MLRNGTVSPLLRIIACYIGIIGGVETGISPFYQESERINDEKRPSLRLEPAHSPKPDGINDVLHS